MALGESVVRERIDLVVDPERDVGRDAIRLHPAEHPLADVGHPLAAPLVPHRLAQEVRLAGRESRCGDRHLHSLLLEERHTERAFEDRLERGVRVGDGFHTRSPPQVRVHHVALDRPRPDQRDLHDEVVEAARLEARQRVHLCAALHLEHAHGVGTAEVVVHRLVGAIELTQVDADAARDAQVRETVLQHGEHAEPEEVDLHEADGVEVVLLPLDDRAVLHARGFDRDDRAERFLGEDEAADVDASVPRGGVEAFDDVGEALHSRVVRVEVRALEQ